MSDAPSAAERARAAEAVGAWAEAAEHWASQCASSPDEWQPWFHRGNALIRDSRWSEAIEALRHAVERNPAERAARRNLANALARVGDHQASAAEFERLIEQSPDDPRLRLALARALDECGRYDEASAHIDEAIRLASSASEVRPQLMREIAMLLERTNRSDALRRLIELAADRGIEREDLGYAAAAIALRDGEPEEALRLVQQDRGGVRPIRWHRLLSRIADTLGRPDEAFAAATAMNRSVRDHEEWRQRARRHLEWTQAFAATITPDWLGRLPRIAPPGRPAPVFLVGFPRSGTTLLDTFLMGHPDLLVLEEKPMMRLASDALGNAIGLAERSPAEVEAARRAYLEELARYADPDDPRTVVDKLPLNMIAAPVIRTMFPDARFIFVQRHPCDAVLSCFMQAFALNDSMACFLDLQDSAAYYDSAMRIWAECREWIGPDVHSVVYEELVTDPEGTLRPLVEFLGLDWHDGLLDHVATAHSRGPISTPSYDQVVQPLNPAPVGRWKRYRDQLAPVLPLLLRWAERLGYRDEP